MTSWAQRTALALQPPTYRAPGRAHSPAELWPRLRRALEELCGDLNQAYGAPALHFELQPTSVAVVRSLLHSAYLKVEFQPERNRVFYQHKAGNGEYAFGVNPDQVCMLLTSDEPPQALPTERVATELLNLLLTVE